MRKFDLKGKCLECNGVGYSAVNGVQRICPSCRGLGSQNNTNSDNVKPHVRKCPICNNKGVYKVSCCDSYARCPLCFKAK